MAHAEDMGRARAFFGTECQAWEIWATQLVIDLNLIGWAGAVTGERSLTLVPCVSRGRLRRPEQKKYSFLGESGSMVPKLEGTEES